MKKINWGIIGPGKIAGKFAATVNGMEDGNLLCVASRTESKAVEFARQYSISRVYGSYEKMLSDPDLDIVYIATPHAFHFEQSMMCIERGIPVLCEKPVTLNASQFKIISEAAGKKNVFFMQAIWTRFLPAIKTTLDILDSGRLGRIRVIEADFGFLAGYDPASRLFNPELGGGSLLDIGIYPVFLSLLLKGYPDKISASAVKAPTGVDESIAMIFQYDDGTVSSLYSTFAAHTPTKASICCENGRIDINNRWFAHASMQVTYNGQDPVNYEFDLAGKTGFEGEISEAMRCIREGLPESPAISSSFSMDLMRLLDQIREICEIHYPVYENIIQ